VRRDSGISRQDVVALVVVVLVIGLGGPLVCRLLARYREEARRITCRSHLNSLAKGMATYLGEHGENRWYPWPTGRGTAPDDFNGAEWLASLYWTRVVTAPWIYICPSSTDSNDDGRDLGTHRADPMRFGSMTVSYAGLHYRSFTDTEGDPKAIDDGLPPNRPMACDDTQGPPHHPSVRSVLFFDSHVEVLTQAELGGLSEGRLPWPLRN